MLSILFLTAIGMLLFGILPSEYNHIIVGFIFIVSAIPHLVIFMLGERFKDPLKMTDFVLIFVSLFLGFLFMFVKNAPIGALVLIWAIFDLTRAIYHFFDSVIEFRHNKLEIIEMVADTIEIVFAILLLFEGEHGIKLHLIMSFVATLIMFSKFTIDFVLEQIRLSKSK